MARITVEDCIGSVPNRFELVLLAAQRARELHLGSPPKVAIENDRNTVVALREIADEALNVDELREGCIQNLMQVKPLEEVPADDLSMDYSVMIEAIQDSAEKSKALRRTVESVE